MASGNNNPLSVQQISKPNQSSQRKIRKRKRTVDYDALYLDNNALPQVLTCTQLLRYTVVASTLLVRQC